MNNLSRVGLMLRCGTGCTRRYVQSNANLLENCVELRNRNPRNLELMTIARKPLGYWLDMPGHEYWHKLVVKVTSKNLVLQINHYKNGPVVTVSTTEYAMKRHLFKSLDITAYTNAGRVLAQRCLESGIGSIMCDIDTENSTKLTALIDELRKGGVVLQEAIPYKNPEPWDATRMIKPWTIVD
ncbi:39S ribosomal protein L18, mitochondrial [Copidosoma floridanum]|uniref:39S ribosomal protein L18, mitochondrial n=1 Tax=Copidosoma floridanum TaxID=29053 RepID=UPI0006C9BFFC|nr:39S ribosomal protein L18, mitochondrial [Copidosoma floridanum]